MTFAYLFLGALLLSFLPALWIAGRAYFRYRGTRVVNCPEVNGPAAVHVDLRHAGVTTAMGEPALRIASCSRWPERVSCLQDCLPQIEAAPAECMVRTMLVDGQQGSDCAFCGRAIGDIHWVEHKPALMTPHRETVEWDEAASEDLPPGPTTHPRVCWNCHIANSWRERFPGLVTDVPPERQAS